MFQNYRITKEALIAFVLRYFLKYNFDYNFMAESFVHSSTSYLYNCLLMFQKLASQNVGIGKHFSYQENLKVILLIVNEGKIRLKF